jgi:hypothetical protein
MMLENLRQRVENVSARDFEVVALEVFRWQAAMNPLYYDYLRLLGKDTTKINTLREIPFLPISFFKTHRIQSGAWTAVAEYTSSGTTGGQTSRHLIDDVTFYLRNSLRGFEFFYGDVANFCVLALLPAYLERTGSSLVAMANAFVERSKYAESGFFLDDLEGLSRILRRCQAESRPTLLLGVSFALWELAEAYPQNLADIIVMETGGMKGRRKELTRPELHDILMAAFETTAIHSEYGMTELLSQAYSKGSGVFVPAPTMRVLVREINDPFCFLNDEQTGCLNVIDLANVGSCSFIATDDLAKTHADGTFSVLGRVDTSDIRGCNLLL